MSPEVVANLENIKEIINSDSLWYLNPVVSSLLDKYFSKEVEKQDHDEGWRKARHEAVKLFASALESGQIQLGNAPEYFNDDDRWCLMNWDDQKGGISFLTNEANPKVEKNHPDTVVIHHSSTLEDVDVRELEALGLLRLYVPYYRSKVFNVNGNYAPVSSGHYRITEDGKRIQTFTGYHYWIFSDGRVVNTLEDIHTGLQSGDYITNCRSVAICFIDDCSEKLPTEEAIKAAQVLIQIYKGRYSIDAVIGHREVVHDGKLVDTKCPGDTWEKLKARLVG